MRKLALLAVLLLPGMALGGTNATLYVRSTQTNGSGVAGSYDLTSVRGGTATTLLQGNACAGTTCDTVLKSYYSTSAVTEAATLDGTVTCNIRGLESSNSANNGLKCEVGYRRSGSDSTICTSAASTEWTTSQTAKSLTCTASSVSLQSGDLIYYKWHTVNVGTGSATYTITAGLDGPTAAAAGDSYVTLPACVPGATDDCSLGASATLTALAGTGTLGAVTSSGTSAGSITDNFPSTGALPANWTAVSGGDFAAAPTVVSANNVSTTAWTVSAAIYTGALFSATQTAQVTIQTTPGSSYNGGVCVRMSAGGNGYCFDPAGSPQLKVYAGGTGTWLASCSAAPSAGQTIEITASGTTITGYVNGAQVCQGTDATYGTGSPGLLVDNNSASTVNVGSFVATGASGSSGDGSATLTALSAIGSAASLSSSGGAARTLVANAGAGMLASLSSSGAASRILTALPATGALAAVSSTGGAARTLVAVGGTGSLGVVLGTSSSGASSTLTPLVATGALAPVGASGAASRTLVAVTGTGAVASLSSSGAASRTLTALGGAGALGAISSSGGAARTLVAVTGAGTLGVLSASAGGSGNAILTPLVAAGALGVLSSSGGATRTLASDVGTGALANLSAGGGGNATLAPLYASGALANLGAAGGAARTLVANAAAGTLAAIGSSGAAAATLVALSATGALGRIFIGRPAPAPYILTLRLLLPALDLLLPLPVGSVELALPVLRVRIP